MSENLKEAINFVDNKKFCELIFSLAVYAETFSSEKH